MSKDTVVRLLQEKGWTREQALGVAANIEQESGFRPNAVGDGGKAYGIAQWHPDRQANFQRAMGKPIQGSSIEDQVSFIDWELRNTEKRAGDILGRAKTAQESGSLFSLHYERPLARDKEAANRGRRAAAMAGEAEAPPAAVAPRQAFQNAPGAALPTFRLPGYPQIPIAAPAASEGASRGLALQAATVAEIQSQGTPEQGAAEGAAQTAAQIAENAKATGLGDVFQAGRRDERLQPLFSLLDRMNEGEKEVPPPGWTYDYDRIESGIREEEHRAYLRENITGPESERRALAQVQYRMELDREVYGRASGAAQFFGQMAAGSLDPVGFAAGLGVTKAFQMARIGSGALIAAGRPGAAVASSLGEAALGNIAVEGIQDALGEVKGLDDYLIAGAMGAAFTAPFTRGVHAEASRIAVAREAQRVQQEAVERQVAGLADLHRETGLEGEPLAREFEKRQQEGIDRLTGALPSTEPKPDSALPGDVIDTIRREHAGEEPPAPPVEPPPPPKPEPVKRPEGEAAPPPPPKPTWEKPVAPEPQEPIPRRLPGQTGQALPPHLSKATPGFNYGQRRLGLTFESDLDKAAYIISGKGKSKAHYEYEAYIRAQGMSVDQAQRYGAALREALKLQAKANPDATTIRVEAAIEPPKPEPGKFDLPVIDESMIGSTANERLVPGRDGTPVSVGWRLRKEEAPLGRSYKVSDVLNGILDAQFKVPDHVKALANYLQQKISKGVDDVSVFFRHADEGKSGNFFNPNTQAIHIESKLSQGTELENHLGNLDPRHLEAVVHEVVHAATHSKIEAWKRGKLQGGEVFEAVNDLEKLRQQYSDAIDAKYPALKNKTIKEMEQLVKDGKVGSTVYFIKYGQKDLHEFATMAMASPEARDFMRQQPGVPVTGQPSSLWRNFVDGLARVLGFKRQNDLWESATATIDRVISTDGSFLRYSSGEGALSAPAMFNGQAQRRNAQSIAQHARQWLSTNPIDSSKLATLNGFTKKWGGISDGLVLAQSKNPILQMVAGLVTEVTTGAAGRRATVSIRKEMTHRRLIGNTLLDYESTFDQWAKANGGTLWDTAIVGDKKREFNRLVYGEILDRRSGTYQPRAQLAVQRAADALEQMFERARVEQINAGTLGSANLPGSSRGYVPQALDGAKLQRLTTQELNDLHAELSQQFQSRLGWDASFADTFAPYYTDRVRRRAQGSKEVDAISGGGNAMQIVRDTLDDMTVDPAMRDRMTAANQARAGLKQTKARLDLDLRRVFSGNKTLLDVYVDDPLTLARMYANRTAGEVALTEQGILGARGVRELRQAAETLTGDGTQATRDELFAFDRVMSEIQGTPVAGQVTSAGATNLRLLVGLQRLGGLVFAQASEAWNMVHHVGLRSTLSSIGALPRMFGEVGRLKKGGVSGNHILTTMETYGGEFGMEHYKMVAPLDPPDAQVEQYMQQTGIIGRLLRGGAHLQSKVSFFRGLLSSQHRAVAEQITMKALRFINEGKSGKYLEDMGFTPQLSAAIRQELPRIAQFDQSGRLVSLDLSNVSDPRIAEALTQAVHRGTSQIIQGTFVGERSAWMHNDYLKLLLQLRTFGLTATEKQLGRVAGINGGGAKGYAYAGGLMLGQMALALPMHAARVHIAAAGREDRDKYVADNLSNGTLIRSLMNYSSMSGSTGDVLDLMTGLAGGWLGQDGKELIGARTGPAGGASIGRLVPAAGSIESILKAAGGQSDLHRSIKQLPFSNLWYLQPALNIAHDNP